MENNREKAVTSHPYFIGRFEEKGDLCLKFKTNRYENVKHKPARIGNCCRSGKIHQ